MLHVPARIPLAFLSPLLCAPVAAAQFVDNTTDIPAAGPGNDSSSENVDFGDVDGDGDWDAVFADGGDTGPDQNHIWINQGGAQAGTKGVFVDDTAARFPAIQDQSRDIEFVDFDGDDDLDLYVANASSITPTASRFWRNTGVHSGVYVDETSTRWVNLGGPGSSVAPSEVLPGGGFLDFSGDGDFADVDNDGDMDLFHSSYGGSFDGRAPSRVFLNDGAGYFSEFNPSGFQLTGAEIADGNPGLWCEGVQSANTLDTTGQFCDVSSSALDIDFGDVDGDFDLDVLHGARQELPRLYHNRLVENGGVLSFRDVTGTLPAGYASGNGHYEQEMGDLDGDGDLDIYGVNWVATQGIFFQDVTFRAESGAFVVDQLVPGSDTDDNEADFIDYDLDGDLDVFVTDWSHTSRVYRNDVAPGGGDFELFEVQITPAEIVVTIDTDVCDVDGDGDYDVFVSTNHGQANLYYENTIRDGGVGPTDVTAPWIPNVEQTADRVPGLVPTVVRAHVYDNAPYYITAYDEVWLEVAVDGGGSFTRPMRWSGGQVFRGEIPGELAGLVRYRVVARDEYGNEGVSTVRSYGAGTVGAPSCAGDGESGVACPCGNESLEGAGEGCRNSQGHGAVLYATGSASLAADDLVLRAFHARPHQPALFVQGVPTAGQPFSDGLLCLGNPSERLDWRTLDVAGAADSLGTSIASAGNVLAPGTVRGYQLWYRDPALSVCGTGSSFSSGVVITWQP